MEEHIKTLIRHGARIGDKPLTLSFYHQAVEECREKGKKVKTFGLILSGLEEYRFLLAIWEDGHVDSGCEDTIFQLMKDNTLWKGARA